MIVTGKCAFDPTALITVIKESSAGTRFLRLRMIDGSELVLNADDHNLDGILQMIKEAKGWQEVVFPKPD